MVFRNGIFRTTLLSIIGGTEYCIHMQSNIESQKQLLITAFNFIRAIKDTNIDNVISEFWKSISSLDIDSLILNNCELVLSINNKETEMNVVGI